MQWGWEETQSLCLRLHWKAQLDSAGVPKSRYRRTLGKHWASANPPRCVSLLCLPREGQMQFPSNIFKHAASASCLQSSWGFCGVGGWFAQGDGDGDGWCKFLAAVTNAVVALLRNKGVNVPLELSFFFCSSSFPLGIFCSFFQVFPCSSLPPRSSSTAHRFSSTFVCSAINSVSI